jgi:Mrp family chromosome partitioning ATPase
VIRHGNTLLNSRHSKPEIQRATTVLQAALQTEKYPPFAVAEAVRSIKVAVDLPAASKSNRVIGITSSLPNEGKSTIATTLALQMSQAGSRVILIDGDLRNPSLSLKLAPSASLGLIDVITALQDVLWTDPSTNLMFLPTVLKTRLPHTSDLLASAPVRKLFEYLREYCDYIVVDLSPPAPVVDVRSTPNLADSYLFVAAAIRLSLQPSPSSDTSAFTMTMKACRSGHSAATQFSKQRPNRAGSTRLTRQRSQRSQGNPVMEFGKPTQKTEMVFAPGDNVIEIIARRYGGTGHQQ